MEDRQQHFQDSGDVMLHGRRINPTPQQWQSQIQAAAPVWAVMRQRQEQSERSRRDRLSQLWEGFSVNDVVILGPEVTKRSYGLDLCDDNGEAILMDGVLVAIEGDYARVRIGRHQGKMVPGCGPMVGELQLIKRSDIVRVSNKPPTLWGDAKSAIAAAKKIKISGD